MKELFLDIGELGWSLYLSAHVRWLRQQGIWPHAVMTLPGRECLYEGMVVDKIFTIDPSLIKKFDFTQQECFGFYGIPDYTVRAYFNAQVPAGYEVARSQPLQALSREEIWPGQMIFKPYPYKAKIDRRDAILVFPRQRKAWPFCARNLPKEFYIKLINTLCDEFRYVIMTIGTEGGAYNINIDKPNYINYIGQTQPVQELIDTFQIAVGAVGSQSLPPKLTLLQGVPTYMIGHTQKRHQEEENWMNTRCGFWEIGFEDYNNFNDEKCIDEIVKFFREE